MVPVRMVVSDIDGTLINSENEIPEAVSNAVAQAIRKGVIFVLATGRVLNSALQFRLRLGLKTPVISCNGALVADESRELFSSTLPKAKLLEVTALLDANDMYYHCYADGEKHCHDIENYGKIRALEINNTMISAERTPLVWHKTGKDMAEAVGSRAIKILYIEEDLQKMLRIKAAIEAMGGLACMNSWHDYVDINMAGVSKATGVQAVADVYGIDMRDILCIGDNENDVAMLRAAGIGVAMDNATDDVKSVADYIAPDNDSNGVAWAIDKFVLKI